MIHPYRDTKPYWILNLSAAPVWHFTPYWDCCKGMRISSFLYLACVEIYKNLNLEKYNIGMIVLIAKLNNWIVIMTRFFVGDSKLMISYYCQQHQHQQKIRYEVLCFLFPLLHKTTEEEFISSIQSLFWMHTFNMNTT